MNADAAGLQGPIQGIFFDVGWTLNAPASGHWMIPARARERLGVDLFEAVEPDILDRALAAGMEYLNANHLVLTEEAEYEQFKQFYALLAEHLPGIHISREMIEKLAWDHVYNDGNYVFYEEVAGTLPILKESYRLGVISDTWPSCKRVLTHAGLYSLFDSVTFSCNLGVFKPDVRMYEHALEGMGLPPSRTIFVDDAPANLDGAVKCGIQPVLIVRGEPPREAGNYPCIRDLAELEALLKKANQLCY